MKDLKARSRNSDPETSYDAARLVEISGKAGSQRRRCYDAIRLQPGLTSSEVDNLLGFSREVAHRRLPELRDAGLLKTGPERVCRIRGTSHLTWFPADPPEPEQRELFK